MARRGREGSGHRLLASHDIEPLDDPQAALRMAPSLYNIGSRVGFRNGYVAEARWRNTPKRRHLPKVAPY